MRTERQTISFAVVRQLTQFLTSSTIVM